MVGFIIGFILIIAVGVVIIVKSLKSSKVSKKKRDAEQTKKLRKAYKFLAKFFITQGYINRVYGKLANLSIYRKDELQALSAKYLIMSWGASGAGILLSIVMFRDLIITLLCTLFALVISTIVIDKYLDRLQEKVIESIGLALDSISQEYMRTQSVVDALNDADVPDIIRRPIDEIFNMLTMTNSELRLQEFCDSTPFRTLQTFAGICYHINNEGDEKDNQGQSNFLQALTMLISDVNSEMYKIKYRKQRFGYIEYMPLVPVFGLTVVESFFTSVMPATAIIYNGPIGYIFRTLTVVSAIVIYLTISRINSNLSIKADDRDEWVIMLLEKPFIKQVVHNIVPRGKKKIKLEKKLKAAISKVTVKQLYVKKLVYAFGIMLFAFLLSISMVSLGKDFLENNHQSLSLIASDIMEQYPLEDIQTMDALYLENPSYYTGNNLEELIDLYMPELSILQKSEQMKRLETKREAIENTYYRWWYTWICFALGFVGWFVPNIMLQFRKMVVKTEEEDDFLQLQTLMSILMHTNIDTLEMLNQLQQHTRIHKDMFLYAYQGYPSSPELEIDRLENKTTLPKFKRFLSKLKLTISELSLKEAYRDLIMEREHTIRMRDMAIKDSVDRKRDFCGPIALLPLMIFILGMFILPIAIIGITEFMGTLSQL